MTVAYLVVAHDNPGHLRRLVSALSSPSSKCFVHIDRKSSLKKFHGLRAHHVHVTPHRRRVYWADYSFVEAALGLLRTAMADPMCFDRFVLLSGADYPLRSAAAIERFFAQNGGKEFINLVAMPSDAADKPLSRLTTFIPRPTDRRVQKGVRRVLAKVGKGPSRRDYEAYLGDLVPYAGSTWWALSREACDVILAFVKRETRAVRFFKNTFCPDESFFQTILGNSDLRSRVARNLTYTDWSASKPHPAYMTEAHLGVFRATSSFAGSDPYGPGEMLFARKFSDAHADLVRQLDLHRAECV
jgi:hypothetical protein